MYTLLLVDDEEEVTQIIDKKGKMERIRIFRCRTCK